MSFVLRIFYVWLLVVCFVGLLDVYSILCYFICFLFLFQFSLRVFTYYFVIIGIVRTYTKIFFNMQVFFIFLLIIFALHLQCC